MNEIKKIVLLMAMEHEAKPLLDSLSFKAVDNVFDAALPMQVFYLEDLGREIWVVINGKDATYSVDNVGSQPAAIATMAAIQTLKPDLVLNAGTAGGSFKGGAKIGDVYVSHDKIIFHDRIIPIPGFDKYGIGGYACCDASGLAHDLNLKTGLFSSGDSLFHSNDTQKVFEENNAVIKDMEVATIAWVASLFQMPLLAVKVVSDLIDTDVPVSEQFVENFDSATKTLQSHLEEILQYLKGKTLADLGEKEAVVV